MQVVPREQAQRGVQICHGQVQFAVAAVAAGAVGHCAGAATFVVRAAGLPSANEGKMHGERESVTLYEGSLGARQMKGLTELIRGLTDFCLCGTWRRSDRG